MRRWIFPVLIIAECLPVFHVACLRQKGLFDSSLLRLGQFDSIVFILRRGFLFLLCSSILYIETRLLQGLPMSGFYGFLWVMRLDHLLSCTSILDFSANEHDLIIVIPTSHISSCRRFHETRFASMSSLDLSQDAIWSVFSWRRSIFSDVKVCSFTVINLHMFRYLWIFVALIIDRLWLVPTIINDHIVCRDDIVVSHILLVVERLFPTAELRITRAPCLLRPIDVLLWTLDRHIGLVWYSFL